MTSPVEEAVLDITRSEPEPFVIAGRTFRLAPSTTMRQDGYIWTLQQEAGIDKLLADVDPAKDLSAFTMKLIAAAYDSGKMFDLLGAITEEVGPIMPKWTIDAAKARAEFFAELTDLADKTVLRGAMSAVILGFFVSGLLSSATSQKYSIAAVDPKTFASDSAPSGDASSSSAAPSTSETGASSSASLPSSTPTATPPSSTGS